MRATVNVWEGTLYPRDRMEFTSEAECAKVKGYIVEANEQNMDRLEELLRSGRVQV